MLRYLFYLLVIRPAAYLLLGMRVRGKPNLPTEGPAIIVANHNSHLDTVVMMALFPLRLLPHVRPVAKASYWLANRRIAWFGRSIIGIVPVEKYTGDGEDPLEGCYEALRNNDILLFFPEGSRGEPDVPQPFKGGVARLSQKFPTVPVIPVALKGTARSWPRGTPIIVPHQCDVWIEKPMYWPGSHQLLLQRLEAKTLRLEALGTVTIPNLSRNP